MIQKLLEKINAKYPLAELAVGDMASMKANGMKFAIRAFHAKGLGHVSVMTAKGFFGLMKMDTLIIHPKDMDLPLYSYDRIYAAGNDTLIVELYDTLTQDYAEEDLKRVIGQYPDLAERDPGQHWYDAIKLSSSISKKGKKAQSPRFDELALKHFDAYLLNDTKTSDIALKQEKAKFYVDGLLTNGGPSTDVFIKSFGEEKTEKLYKTILFGID